LKREIEEETGLKVDVVNPIHVAKRGNPQKYSVFFLCKLIDKQDVKISNEHNESKRIKFTDIEKIEWHNINSKIAAEKAGGAMRGQNKNIKD
jgi:8-oxo-dGTP pyrophosphatase MutT (NUDIX family)